MALTYTAPWRLRHKEAIGRVLRLLPVAVADGVEVLLHMGTIAVGHLHAHQHPPIGGAHLVEPVVDPAGEAALLLGRAAEQAGWVLAAELSACGIDLSFTPVLDLNWGQCAVIGNRSFHQSAEIVAELARA